MSYIDLLVVSLIRYLRFDLNKKTSVKMGYILVFIILLFLLRLLQIQDIGMWLFYIGLPIFSILIGVGIRIFRFFYMNNNAEYFKQLNAWLQLKRSR